jgi:hypothetical protein
MRRRIRPRPAQKPHHPRLPVHPQTKFRVPQSPRAD